WSRYISTQTLPFEPSIKINIYIIQKKSRDNFRYVNGLVKLNRFPRCVSTGYYNLITIVKFC
ncbi:hypothetical protein KAS56_01400, partial [candidate division WOR-3 bacterium]|nr:hypothetical protein [candidate division WOR-3 bacterium]